MDVVAVLETDLAKTNQLLLSSERGSKETHIKQPVKHNYKLPASRISLVEAAVSCRACTASQQQLPGILQGDLKFSQNNSVIFDLKVQ